MPTQAEKIKGRAEHLLNGFLGLRERYAMLEPMLFDATVVDAFGAGRRSRGFGTLKIVLFLAISQEIAKLTWDDAERAPSINNLMSALQNDALRAELRAEHAVWGTDRSPDETDPQVKIALERMEAAGAAKRLDEHDAVYTQALRGWGEIQASPRFMAFKTIRDKVSAHTEVMYSNGEYHLLDTKALGIVWSDLRESIKLMQGMVERLGLLIRSASFAWDGFDRQLDTAYLAFWQAPADGGKTSAVAKA